MNLYKVKLWIKDNEWRESLILSESEQEAINKAMSEVSEEYLIDLIVLNVVKVFLLHTMPHF